MSFSDWKKNSVLFNAFKSRAERYGIGYEEVSQAAYKAGERAGIKKAKAQLEAAEAKLRELEMQEQELRDHGLYWQRRAMLLERNVPDEAYCAAGVEPCACAVANNLDAARYRALRNQDIESNFPRSGVFIGKVPDNQCLTGVDADQAVDALFPSKQEEK